MPIPPAEDSADAVRIFYCIRGGTAHNVRSDVSFPIQVSVGIYLLFPVNQSFIIHSKNLAVSIGSFEFGQCRFL